MHELQLQYRAQQYWFPASGREAYFLAKAVAYAGEASTQEQIIAQLRTGVVVRTGTDWDDQIRSLAALLVAQTPAPPEARKKCDCGHTIPVQSVMNASLGSACPACYDRMSD